MFECMRSLSITITSNSHMIILHVLDRRIMIRLVGLIGSCEDLVQKSLSVREFQGWWVAGLIGSGIVAFIVKQTNFSSLSERQHYILSTENTSEPISFRL